MTKVNFTKKQLGFTLVELLITIAIAAILLGVALPSFNRTIDNSRLTAATNGIIGALNLARSEAIDLGNDVVVAISADASWTVTNSATNELIRQSESQAGITTSAQTITYTANGFRPIGSSLISLDVSNASETETLSISVSGSVK
jgi:type IV fimbrial biogenesis protein FimT